MKGYYIYFYYNKNDELMYIGQAVDVGKRWQSHQEPWKKEVCKIGVREYTDHASMDIFEHYYITKLPTKYNKGLLYHGHTTVDIPDSSPMKVYTLDEFKEKYLFCSKNSRSISPMQNMTIDEKLAYLGNTIIEVQEESINLFDDKWLKLDLDKICFKHNNFYLISNYTRTPGKYITKDAALASFVTNKKILSLKNLLNNPSFEEITEGDSKVWKATLNRDSAYNELKNVLECTWLYESYEKNTYKTGREYFSNTRTLWTHIDERAIISEISDEQEQLEIIISKRFEKLNFIKINREEFILNFNFEATDH